MSRHVLTTLAIAATIASAVVLYGCGQSPQARAAGTYDLDKARAKAAMQAQIDATEDPEEKMGLQFAIGMIDGMSMSITLNEDGSATGSIAMMGKTERATGSWTISDSTISVTLAEEGEEPDTMTGTISGDTIEISSPDDDAPFPLVFTKRPAS